MQREIEMAARPHKLIRDFIASLTPYPMLILSVGDLIRTMTRMANVMLIFPDQNRPRAEPPKIPPVILKLRMRVYR